jgi:hypothetical protein
VALRLLVLGLEITRSVLGSGREETESPRERVGGVPLKGNSCDAGEDPAEWET